MIDWVLGLIGGLLYPLFSIIYICIDGLQGLFFALAGIGDIRFGAANNAGGENWGTGQQITSGNTGGETDTGIIYYLFQNSLVKNLLLSIMLLALFLVIIFTVMAFIKNAYAAKQKSWKEIIGNAIKGLGNFILLPVMCLLGVWLANILLQAINGATSGGGATQMSRKLFIAASYNANEFRNDNPDISNANIEKLQDWADGRVYLDTNEKFNGDSIQLGQSAEYYANIVDQIYATTSTDIYSYWSVEHWYSLWEINYLVLIVGGVFMLYALGALAFGMVRRMFLLVILFVVSPGVCALYPLDEGKAVQSWSGEVKKNVLSVHGSVAAINIFFALLPLIDNLHFSNGFGAFAGIDDLLQLFILTSGLLCVKEFTGLLSGFIGGEDALAKGTGLMKSATGALKKYAGGTVKKTAGAFGKARGEAVAGKGHTFTNLLRNSVKDASNSAIETMTGINLKDTKKTFKDARKEAKEHAWDNHDTRTHYMKNKQDEQFKLFFKNKDGSERKKAYNGADLKEFYEFLDTVKDKKAKERYAEQMADFNNRINTNQRQAKRDADGNMILDYVDEKGKKHYKTYKSGGGKIQSSSELIEAADEYKGHKKNMQYQERSLEPIITAFKAAQESSNVKTFATQMGIDISDVSLKNFEEIMTRAIKKGMFDGSGDKSNMINQNALLTRLVTAEKFSGKDVAEASEEVAKAMQMFNDMLTFNAADDALHDAVVSLSKEVKDSAKKLKIDDTLDISGLEKSLKDASKQISETFDKLKKLENIGE